VLLMSRFELYYLQMDVLSNFSNVLHAVLLFPFPLNPLSVTTLVPAVLDNSCSSGSTMIYLFEKVASITDCRRTGHFVLPKRKVEVNVLLVSQLGTAAH